MTPKKGDPTTETPSANKIQMVMTLERSDMRSPSVENAIAMRGEIPTITFRRNLGATGAQGAAASASTSTRNSGREKPLTMIRVELG